MISWGKDYAKRRDRLYPSRRPAFQRSRSCLCVGCSFRFSFGCQQAYFCVAPRPIAQSIKPCGIFPVPFQPDKGHRLILKAPRLDQTQRLGQLGKGCPQEQGAVFCGQLCHRQSAQIIYAHGGIVVFCRALHLSAFIAPRWVGINDIVFSDSHTSVNVRRTLRLPCCRF